MRVAVGNIKANPLMRKSRVEHDTRVLARLGGVVFGSEIEYAYYTRAWTAIMLLRGLLTFNTAVECPISAKSHYWGKIAAYTVLTHKGKRTVSPNRYLSVLRAYLKHGTKDMPADTKVAFIATHYVSGGWHRGFKAYRQWRKDHWAVHHKVHKSEILRSLAEGYHVVTGGDFNRVGDMNLHPDAVLLAVHGLDHLYAVPLPGWKVVLDGPQVTVSTQEIFTDHPMIAREFHFERVA